MSEPGTPQDRSLQPHAGLAVALGWLLALGVLVLALAATGARIGLAQLPAYSDWLEQRIEQQLGLEAEVTGLRGRVQGWLPRLSADRVALRPPGADTPAIVLRDLDLELDPLRSLLHRFPVASALVMGASEIDLTLTDAGTPGLLGGEVPARVQLSALADLFYLAGYVRLEESRIRLHAIEAPERFDTLWLQGELSLRRGHGRGYLDLRYLAESRPDEVAPGLVRGRLHYGLNGRPWVEPDWRGTAALQGTGGQLGAIAGRLAPVDLRLQGAVDRFNLILARAPGRGRELQGEIALPELRFPGRASLHGVDLAVAASGIDQPDGAVRLTRLRAETVGRALQLDGTAVLWHGDRPGHWFVELPDLDLQAAAEVVAQLPTWPDVARHWLAGLAPTGQLRGGRLAMAPDQGGAWFHGDFRDLSLQAFQGIPGVEGLDGALAVHGGGGWIDIDSGPFSLHVANVFPSAWNYRGGRGRLQLQLVDGRVQLTGRDLQVQADHVAASADLAVDLTRPEADRQLALRVGIERGQASAARDYLPRNLPPGLRVWLAEALQAGAVTGGGILLHAGLAPEAAASRVPQLHFQVSGGDLRFAPDWPLATALEGVLGLHHGDFGAHVRSGRLLAGELHEVDIAVPAGSREVELRGRVRGAAGDLLESVRRLPLQDQYRLTEVIQLDSGQVAADLSLLLDLEAEALLDRLDADVHLDAVAATFPALDLAATELTGAIVYSHPARLHSRDLRARSLGGTADLNVRQDAAGEIRLGIEGQARADAVAEWLAIDWLAAATGEFPYNSETRIRVPGDIDVLVQAGTRELRPGLPAPLAVPGELLELDLHVPASGRWELGLQWGALTGQFDLEGREMHAGTIGLGTDPPALPEHGWRLAAKLGGIDLEKWWSWATAWQPAAGDHADGNGEPMPLSIELESDQLLWGGWQLGPGALTLEQDPDATRLELFSEQLAGTLRRVPEQPLELELAHLRWPFPRHAIELDQEVDALVATDPLALGWLGAADVEIRELWLDDRLLGEIGFQLQVAGKELVLDAVRADLRGLGFGDLDDASARLIWQGGERPRSHLRGRLSGEDAAAVLQAWGLAPTVEAEAFHFDLDLAWPGAPMAFAPELLQGQIALGVERGRFVQFDAGAAPLRVVGLFNFAAIARRMRLDFTDVYRRGIAFESIDGVLALDQGQVRSQEAVRIGGPGSSFRLTGSLDLLARSLDADIIVTLPVSENMPWFAAYAVLLANPLAGAGVFVAERVFRDQIDRFSSARYRLQGTFDQPDVSFVSIFPTEPDVPITLPTDQATLAPDLDLDWLIELDAPLDWLRPVPLLPSQEDDT